ncbi:MAG: GNAT family N-acetyltransferase [Candidatus Omnitrophica bacterium]|nr:GNAT family N-acetyltransferase [Candidatus Omnitrophota bacterium]
MQNSNHDLQFFVLDTINSISKDDWDNLFDENILEGYGYHKAFEESHIKEFTLKYLVAKRNNAICAIIPFFISDFSFSTLIQGSLQKIILNIQSFFKRFLKMRMLFVGFPTTEELYLGISKKENKRDFFELLVKEFSRISKKMNISVTLFFNLAEKDKLLAQVLYKKNFVKMENYPNTMLAIKGETFEEYLSSLSRNTRKDFKRKLRDSAALTILTTEVIDNIDSIKNEIFKLYLNNFSASEVQFETLTPDFFQNIFKYMKENAKMFITRSPDNKILAFNLCLIKNDTCIDKFIGFDKKTSHKLHLYHATFHHNITWCLKNKIRYYQMGITDYHPKIRLGAKLIPLFVYFKCTNPILWLFAKPIAKIIQPKNFDPGLKNIKK